MKNAIKPLMALAVFGLILFLSQIGFSEDQSPIPDGSEWPSLKSATVKVVGENWWNFSILEDNKGGLIAARQTQANEETKGETPAQGVVVVEGKAYGNITEDTYKDTLGKVEGIGGLKYRMIRGKPGKNDLLKMFNDYIQNAHTRSHEPTPAVQAKATKVDIKKEPAKKASAKKKDVKPHAKLEKK